ncbi:phosphatase 2C-like domain-containing protein [Gigaspora rosea]|uniref:Phosphatase 2C-like domain-containing protein n=1 Tax=Gigaspora rosea TaxID=44941 RepID=A0A397U987_9GLOM|nr:phosphatase 2C-like domain-containing protein [Gigaspora rosea]
MMIFQQIIRTVSPRIKQNISSSTINLFPYFRSFKPIKIDFRQITQTSVYRSQEYYLVKSPQGENYRLHLAKSSHLAGTRTSRGNRESNEDRYQALVLEFNKTNNKFNDNVKQVHLDKKFSETNGQKEGKDGQICYFALFDGHGGSQCADYLIDNLHKRIEDIQASNADDIISQWRKAGGYFRRFMPPTLEPSPSPTYPVSNESTKSELTLEQRLTLSFLKTDLELIDSIGRSTGSTASIALVKTLDGQTFWSSKELEITVAHVGDTRVLLCDAHSGNAVPLTFDHHPSSVSELDRLQKYGGYVITDSFGSEMILGRLANTRAFGDSKMKRYGISAEPEIISKTVKGDDVAFMVLISDGVTSVLSNQEIIDCIKNYDNVTTGAEKLVELAEELGSDDNITAMVIRLPAWGTKMPDHTKALREYRLENDKPAMKRRM